MKAYILRRCLLLVPILFGITLIVFSFMHIIPGDPIDIMLGETAQAVSKDHFRKLLHQDKPIPLQYILFLKDVFTGNLKSIPSEENVWAKISERFPATAELAIWAMVFAIVISIPLGMLAAVKHKTYLDGISMLISLLGISIPHFWLDRKSVV